MSQLVNPENVTHYKDVPISGLSADSRLVTPGDIFAALPSVTPQGVDGRTFIQKAIENGAACILTLPGLGDIGVPVIENAAPRREYTRLAAKLFPGQPENMVVVTGTNGKSSTVEFLRQIWDFAGKKAACFGTLGIRTQDGLEPLTHTTPDAVTLHKTLSQLSARGIHFCGMEGSSHGLKQFRLDEVKPSAVAFTNLTQDHFDYHPDIEDYFQSKARLFHEIAPKNCSAIINVDSEFGEKMAILAEKSGLKVIRVGWAGEDIRIAEIMPKSASQRVDLVWDGKRVQIDIPLAGEFQILNVVTALGLAVQTGVEKAVALKAVQKLTGVSGRMERAGMSVTNAPIFVDFAHTPDGLEKLLRGVRPHTQGRIILVFGCGGDRDPEKRPIMGKIAAKLADTVIVTDDNPRFENPDIIRLSVLQGCPDADNIGDRKDAISFGISLLAKGDCLVIAGKGHESGQIIGDKVIPFNDAQIVREILA
ncbi:MAG TPA: UDP-N-acetylmuramoyl-L-alanyl-D-glutamate--2,6-diaminopimelate ligase [Hellea balneolensis]|uniref:UDP-N-acetylmuramoyl-L-alanyl-D-glutamate--2,6-diaminopimelate ligase n=1 Tax=Hellea balneolensis TaxID=287478 RepID=A0A7C5LRY1_9PROT|nr:UDP-N-acetylmuramoyl-L-alanyl-D-glutamate--2,6-diaminopimelate ligase [Hellea balneolensis]